MHAILPDSRFAVNSLQPGGEMTEQFIKDLVITYTGDPQPGPVYGRTMINRWKKTRYVSVIRKDKVRGIKFDTFEADTEELATAAVKEGLRKQIGLITAPVLVPDEGDEDIDFQMILRDRRETRTKIGAYKCHALGYRILSTMEERGLDNDPYADSIKLGEAKKVLLGEAIAKFLTNDIGLPDIEPLVPGRKQSSAVQSHLQILVNKFGADIPVRSLAEEQRTELIAFYRTEIVKKGSLKLSKSYRAAIRRIWKRFFAACKEPNGIIRLPASMFEERSEGTTPLVITPKPDVIWKFLNKIITEHPELLLFVIFQLCLGERPQEAYHALGNPMQYLFIDDKRFFFPARTGKAKQQTKVHRNVFLRPLTLWLLSLVPGLLDGSVTDFRVPLRHQPKRPGKKGSVTVYYSVTEMQGMVYKLLKDSGFDWEGSMPDEILRKVFLSSLHACGVPQRDIMQEAAHVNPATLRSYIDEMWSNAQGIALWSMTFDGQPPYGRDLFDRYRAFGQPRPKAKKSSLVHAVKQDEQTPNKSGQNTSLFPRRKRVKRGPTQVNQLDLF